MSLLSRIQMFDQIENVIVDAGLWPHRVHPLLMAVDLPGAVFDAVYTASREYAMACCGPGPAGLWPNMTPNGLLVPKKEFEEPYNHLVRRYLDVVRTLGIGPLIEAWHVAFSLRIKFGEPADRSLARPRASEIIHSDSWAGVSNKSIGLMIPIFGDIEANHVAFYAPPDDFHESWLGPRKTYRSGGRIARRYTRIPFVMSASQAILADFALLHVTERLPGAGTRGSLDATFTVDRGDPTIPDLVHPDRDLEMASHAQVDGLGETWRLEFPMSVDDPVPEDVGYKYSASFRWVPIE